MNIRQIVSSLFSLLRRRKHTKRPTPRSQDVTLGVSVWAQNMAPAVVFTESHRCQHLGIIGLSGTGKTHFLEHMIRQDIRNKTGLVVFDVHGDLADSIVAYLADWALEHPDVYERTVLIEPFNQTHGVGFNPLERRPNTSPHLQAQELAAMLHERWNEESGSPRTEELLRNSLYTLVCNDATLAELPDLLTDSAARSAMVDRLPIGPVRDYFVVRFDRMSEKMQRLFAEPVLNRISSFIADPQIRDMVAQPTSTFSFRSAIQNGQWVIVNLAKGRLGENASILGRLLFKKLELDVMSLADVPADERKFFVIYADELQNLVSATFSRLVAEARKYRVALVAGHQFWHQLEGPLRQAMLAVGSKALFRLHYHDAVDLAGELAARERQRFTNLLTILDRGEAVVRLGAGRPTLITVPAHRASHPSPGHIERLRMESAKRFAREKNSTPVHEATHIAEAIRRGLGNEH